MPLKISVYVPCYNAERTIGACLASLIAQRRKPDEILLVDDGSTDRAEFRNPLQQGRPDRIDRFRLRRRPFLAPNP